MDKPSGERRAAGPRAVKWFSGGETLHVAKWAAGGSGGALYLMVERLGEAGWDWQVWDDAGQGRLYGVADTLEEAKAGAERALEALARQRGQAAWEAPRQTGCPGK